MKSNSTDGGLTGGGDAMAIGTLAARAGLPAHVLRHWEAVGLLAPARDAAGRRRYGPRDAFRVGVILRAKESGLSLEDIRVMLAADGPEPRRTVLLRHRAALRRRVAEARTALGLVECALDCTHSDLESCPHFRGAVAARTPPTAPTTHAAGTAQSTPEDRA